MGVGLVIVAAGNGTRMGGNVRKPYLQLGDDPILILTLKKFLSVTTIDEFVLVVHSDEVQRTEQLLASYHISNVQIVHGGRERQDSVQSGLNALSNKIDYALIHDGARPFVSSELILRLIDEVKNKKAVIPAIPVKDTIKLVEATGVIVSTPDRKGLWAAQTPQAFSLPLIKRAIEEAEQKGIRGTDDASVLESLGYSVHIEEGEGTNIKITTPEDLLFGEVILRLMEEKK